MSAIKLEFTDGTITESGFRATDATPSVELCVPLDVAMTCGLQLTRPGIISAVQLTWWEGKISGIKFFCEDLVTVVYDSQTMSPLGGRIFNTAGALDVLQEEDSIKLIPDGETLMGFEARKLSLDALYGFEFFSGVVQMPLTGFLQRNSVQGATRQEYPDATQRLAIWNGEDPTNDCYSPVSVMQFASDGIDLGINFFSMFLENSMNFPVSPIGEANGYMDGVHDTGNFLAIMQPGTRIASWES